MFSFTPCSATGCTNLAVTGSQYCLVHAQTPEAIASDILDRITSDLSVHSLTLTNTEIRGRDFSGSRIISCNLARNIFIDCTFSEASIHLSFFDFSKFINCSFGELNSRYAVFAGSELTGCTFEGSDMLHTNFLGASIRTASFNDSDLYFSIFTHSYLESVSFRDCNLKKVDFHSSERKDVSFKYSNYEEAIFTRE